MSLRSDQHGFTLVELLISMVLSLIVVSAAFALVSSTERASKRVVDRVDSSQRGRTAMERMTRSLRAMACPEPPAGGLGASPILSASTDQITFYANVVDPARLRPDATLPAAASLAAQNAAFLPERRQLEVIRDTAGKPVAIRENRWSNGEPPAAPVVRPVISYIEPLPLASGGVADVLRFYPYEDDPTVSPAPFAAAAGVSSANLLTVAQVRIAYRTRPSNNTRDALATVDMDGSVYARTVTNQRGSASGGSNPSIPNERFFQCQ